MQDMIDKSEATAQQLKLIAHPCRLLVLCALVEGEKNVSELTSMANVSQTLMSNHLALLRKANIVDYKRDHRTLNYYLKDERMKQVLMTLHNVYCENKAP